MSRSSKGAVLATALAVVMLALAAGLPAQRAQAQEPTCLLSDLVLPSPAAPAAAASTEVVSSPLLAGDVAFPEDTCSFLRSVLLSIAGTGPAAASQLTDYSEGCSVAEVVAQFLGPAEALPELDEGVPDIALSAGACDSLATVLSMVASGALVPLAGVPLIEDVSELITGPPVDEIGEPPAIDGGAEEEPGDDMTGEEPVEEPVDEDSVDDGSGDETGDEGPIDGLTGESGGTPEDDSTDDSTEEPEEASDEGDATGVEPIDEFSIGTFSVEEPDGSVDDTIGEGPADDTIGAFSVEEPDESNEDVIDEEPSGDAVNDTNEGVAEGGCMLADLVDQLRTAAPDAGISDPQTDVELTAEECAAVAGVFDEIAGTFGASLEDESDVPAEEPAESVDEAVPSET